MHIFATQSSEYLARPLTRALKASAGTIEHSQFDNAEHYMRIIKPGTSELRGKDVVVVSSIVDDADLLELYRLGSTLADIGTRQRIFVIPYLAYSTMEVAKQEGEVVTAKANARLLSSLPKASSNTFLFLDLHEPSLKHYFEGDATVIELSAIELLAKTLKKERIPKPIVGSADLGMPQQTQHLASLLRADIALVSKSRRFSHTAVLAAVGNVKDRNVIIYDDMVRSGSSLTKAAQAYKKAGAKNVWAAISHFATTKEDILHTLHQSGIKAIITTNSHPASQRAKKVTNITTLFAPHIKKLLA